MAWPKPTWCGPACPEGRLHPKTPPSRSSICVQVRPAIATRRKFGAIASDGSTREHLTRLWSAQGGDAERGRGLGRAAAAAGASSELDVLSRDESPGPFLGSDDEGDLEPSLSTAEELEVCVVTEAGDASDCSDGDEAIGPARLRAEAGCSTGAGRASSLARGSTTSTAAPTQP